MTDDPRDQEERATRDQASMMKLPYCDIRVDGTVKKLANVMDQASIVHFHAVPLRLDGSHLYIGITVKTPQKTIEALKAHFENLIPSFEVISETSFSEVVRQYLPPKKVDPGIVNIADAGASKNLGEVSLQLDTIRGEEVFRYLTTQAIALGASDIHIEPHREGVRIRFRIDGRLHPVAVLTHEKHGLLEMELASRANIKRMVNIPQAGRFSQAYFDKDRQPQTMNMRVETMPVLFGTEAVIRLFNLDVTQLSIKDQDFGPSLPKIEALLARPYGLALVVGPTGSGKTTSLYTFINELNSPQRKIVTLEDPVEYELPGVSQVPVSGDDEFFMKRLEAVLREDPDVIMIGEIRNFDTAKTSLQAALTGHLVLSTFHAGSAAAAVARLLDMVAFNPLLSAAIRLVIAQRLVRKLCQNCMIPAQLQPAIKELLDREMATLPEAQRIAPTDMKIHGAGPGCDVCHHIGYVGRMVIREVMFITPEFETFLSTDQARTAKAVEDYAIRQGMRTLLQDGLLKVASGLTSIEEIALVADVR